jgi:WD40 repeat protein
MKKNSFSLAFIGLILAITLMGCTTNFTGSLETPTQVVSTEIVPTLTPMPTYTPTSTPTATIPPSPTFTPTPEFLALEGTPLPPILQPITTDTAILVSSIAEWVVDPVVDLSWVTGVYQLAVAHPESIVFYDLASRNLLRQLYPKAGEIVDIDFSPDGKWLVSGSRELDGDETYRSNLEIWNGPDWKPLGVFYGVSGGLTGMAFTSDSQNLLVTYTFPEPEQTGWIDFWNIPDWKIANRIGTGTLLEVAVSADHLRMATTPNRYSIMIWDLDKRERLFNFLTSFTGAVNTMAFSPDRVTLATGHYDGTIRLWDALGGILLLEIPGEGVVESLAYNPDGTVLAASLNGDQPSLALFDTNNGQVLNRFSTFPHVFTSILFSPDGQLFISGSYDGTIRTWGIRP